MEFAFQQVNYAASYSAFNHDARAWSLPQGGSHCLAGSPNRAS